MNYQIIQQDRTLKINITLLVLVLFSFNVLYSCRSNNKKTEPDEKELLALALYQKNFQRASVLLPKVRMTENSVNIIQLFMQINSGNLLKLESKVDYLKQFYSSMDLLHQSMLDEMIGWLYIKQIYRHEISPPIRIIQREELYLEPSQIDFSNCPSHPDDCAMEIRGKLTEIFSDEQISVFLKKMAIKDPCVNTSSGLQGGVIANRCLKKSKGQLKIELLPKPRFNTNQWLQIIKTSN